MIQEVQNQVVNLPTCGYLSSAEAAHEKLNQDLLCLVATVGAS